MITQLLKDKLACPSCMGPLRFDNDSIKCLSCGAVYEVIDGIPIMLPADIKKQSDKESAFWEDYWGKTPMHDIAEVPKQADIISVTDHVVPLWDKYGKDCFFEAGCGTGRLLYLLAKKGINVIGYDNSPAALKYTARFLKAAGVSNYHLVCGDMRYLPFKDNTLGMIYGGGSIEHFDGQQKAIN